MKQYLAFYKVDNHKEYDRHSFDNMSREEIIDCLTSLYDEEVRFYELTVGVNTPYASLSHFINDYNNEELDGGWWSILIL